MRLGKDLRDRLVTLTETAAHWLTRYVTIARRELAAGQKEYGYRNGQLLVTAAPPTAVNVALATNGAVATASSVYDPLSAFLTRIPEPVISHVDGKIRAHPSPGPESSRS